MENQEKEFIREVTKDLMNIVLENKLTSFSIISKDSTDEHLLDAVICGKPMDIIYSLILTMNQNYDVYKMVKTAVMGYEMSKDILPKTASPSINAEEMMKSIFGRIHNG